VLFSMSCATRDRKPTVAYVIKILEAEIAQRA
jgi:hypothetical protein